MSNGELTLERDARIGIRIPSSDARLLKRICASRREDLSDFVRRAVATEMARLSFGSALEKKALGIKPEKTGRIGGEMN
jgi:hypothetical protein